MAKIERIRGKIRHGENVWFMTVARPQPSVSLIHAGDLHVTGELAIHGSPELELEVDGRCVRVRVGPETYVPWRAHYTGPFSEAGEWSADVPFGAPPVGAAHDVVHIVACDFRQAGRELEVWGRVAATDQGSSGYRDPSVPPIVTSLEALALLAPPHQDRRWRWSFPLGGLIGVAIAATLVGLASPARVGALVALVGCLALWRARCRWSVGGDPVVPVRFEGLRELAWTYLHIACLGVGALTLVAPGAPRWLGHTTVAMMLVYPLLLRLRSLAGSRQLRRVAATLAEGSAEGVVWTTRHTDTSSIVCMATEREHELLFDQLDLFTELYGPLCSGNRVLVRGKTVFASHGEPRSTLARMLAWDRTSRIAMPIVAIAGASCAAIALW